MGFRIYGVSDDLLHIMGEDSGIAAIEDETGLLTETDAAKHSDKGQLEIELGFPFDGPFPDVELRPARWQRLGYHAVIYGAMVVHVLADCWRGSGFVLPIFSLDGSGAGESEFDGGAALLYGGGGVG